MYYRLGIDAGSTTLKVVVLDMEGQVLYQSYKRHYSKVKQTLAQEFQIIEPMIKNHPIKVALTGSAGYGLAGHSGLPFVQEVYATTYKLKQEAWDIDVVIELGGEDAKIIYLTGGIEERMNSTCAGGTGAFIDQMASLMNLSTIALDALSLESHTIYQIASRCGVFAKSDIQPLLNQGASKADLSASIFKAVVDQTITGLAQGRKIQGKVLFLGGPLHYYAGLKKQFMMTLGLIENQTAIFPEQGQYFVALGAATYAMSQESSYTFDAIKGALLDTQVVHVGSHRLPPLFEDESQYRAWLDAHHQQDVLSYPIAAYEGVAYLGIDAGSTTTKIILLGEANQILYQYYASNKGNPVEVIHRQLKALYALCGTRIQIVASGVTGYGEELIKSGFGVDFGIVETVAHLTAAKYFEPEVSFILDIGGQDIKCFKLNEGKIESIILNEACSSGCGSFIETFASQMGYSIEEFVQLALSAQAPVDLGSRCTVFMNSSVKEAQKDGATLADVSAGLAISVVKNALYKVIRAHDLSELGTHIVVQGGTLYNDAILRALELELKTSVVRPNIAGLMGAFGVALYAKAHRMHETRLITPQQLESFTHRSQVTTCGLCTNHCHLIINTFQKGQQYISGNRCERPQKNKALEDVPNLYHYKYQYLRSLENSCKGKRGIIGIPMVLNMYELFPFWQAFFNQLGVEVVRSDPSTKGLYTKGQHTIPSDTVCYPAKLAHGHIMSLIEKGVKHIFYPCMSYNLDEQIADNCFNCPVVAYYPELLQGNIEELREMSWFAPYITLNHTKVLEKKLYHTLKVWLKDLSQREVSEGVKMGFKAIDCYKQAIKEEALRAVAYAREHHKPIVVLAGRPYHIDPEISHGIDQLIVGLGAVVVSEDAVYTPGHRTPVNVLNQWTYQARLYGAAEYVVTQPDMELVHLVSFGCGTDAITSDEVKAILNSGDKLYTQIKIDETSNLGAAKIRLRSMFASTSKEVGVR